MNKKILSAFVLLLTFSFCTKVFASLTFTTNAITGTSASTIDLGSGNNLYLQTSGGKLGLGTTSPTNILSLDGTTAKTIWMERNITAATAGQGLTISSGGAIAGTNNLAGGDLTLKSGISTGTGTSAMHFYTATAGSSGNADNVLSEKMIILGNGNVAIGPETHYLTFPNAKMYIRNSDNNNFGVDAGTKGLVVETNFNATDGTTALLLSARNGGSGTVYGATINTTTTGNSSNVIGSYLTNTAQSVTGVNSYGYVVGGTFIGATMGNSYGFYAANPTSLGSTITNNYGVYVENQTAGTNNFAIYSVGGKNYFGGNVGIGTTAPAGALDITSTTAGFLPPRMTTTQRNAVTPVEGLTVYDLTLHKLYVYDGTTWQATW